MDSNLVNRIKALEARHPKSSNETFSYGTAGFRMLAAKLDSVVFSVGLLAALRSKKLGKTIGVMITASHNPPEDNGVKIVDPMGEMLEQSWEKYATAVANSNDLITTLSSIAEEQGINLSAKSVVVIGRDSRISGEKLVQAAVDGLKGLDTEVHDFGLLTTPQLHYLTRTFNDVNFGEKSEAGYYHKLSAAFIEHYSAITTDRSEIKVPALGNEKLGIVVDAANGIGADKIVKLQKYLLDYVDFSLVNGNFTVPSSLNVGCGADYVKTNQKIPAGIEDPSPGQLYCSFDGDADRIVFYYVDDAGVFHLLDGDKIATMLASFFAAILKPLKTDLKVGIIQTAYANGSSTKYIKEVLKLPVECTPTGVKHLHHRAQQYDVGIYFEANGHGTVLFSDKFVHYVNSVKVSAGDSESSKSIQRLRTLIDLINQTVGDAISDLLAVLLICAGLKQTAKTWDEAYVDLPNKLAKVIVKDRNAFTTTDAERKLITPEGLQGEIDRVVSKYEQGRSFVRASGTEDAVRVYAEANTKEECEELSVKVVELVKKFAV